MARMPDNVLSNWHHSIAGFQSSSQDFYTRVTGVMERHEIPDSRISRVEFREAGLASARREYLRVERERLTFDICAAPFGSGFFVSWWLARPPVAWWIVVIALGISVIGWAILFALCGAVVGVFGRLLGSIFGAVGVLLAYPVSVVAYFVALHLLARASLIDEEIIVALPVIGWIYARIFSPITYYRLDTAQMFRDAVHTAVLEALDGMTSEKGVRALTELERKPVMRGLLGP
jgi:hypothetical protein